MDSDVVYFTPKNFNIKADDWEYFISYKQKSFPLKKLFTELK